MRQEFLSVIEDNLIQLRIDAESGRSTEVIAEAEARLLSNLAVLVAAGETENPEAFCAEIVGRVDEIRLQTRWDGGEFALVRPHEVLEDVRSHRFTYLHLHNGEALAAASVGLAPRTTAMPTRQEGYADASRSL